MDLKHSLVLVFINTNSNTFCISSAAFTYSVGSLDEFKHKLCTKRFYNLSYQCRTFISNRTCLRLLMSFTWLRAHASVIKLFWRPPWLSGCRMGYES